MSHARIIVTSSIGVEGIPAKNDSDLIIREKPEDFAAAIVDLINNPDQLSKISQNAFTFVEDHFENTKLVGNFLRFLKEHDINS